MKNIKLIVLDVDGVLTDGSLYIGSDDVEYKKFNTQDGMGITLAHYAGIKTAIITGRQSEAVNKRARELKINYVFQGISNKLTILNDLMSKLGLREEDVCYIGDDINDLPILNKVGKSFAPNNAVEYVKDAVDIVTTNNGGNGAVREMIEIILSEQTNLPKLVNEFIYGENKIVQ